MVNSISTSFIRGLCDEIGYTTSVDSDGDILIRLSADNYFGHDVLVFIRVSDNKLLRIFSLTDLTIGQHDVGKTLVKLNEYNHMKSYMTAYLQNDGRVVVERLEVIDVNVSEEFIKENCIKACVSISWNFFKDNFSEY